MNGKSLFSSYSTIGSSGLAYNHHYEHPEIKSILYTHSQTQVRNAHLDVMLTEHYVRVFLRDLLPRTVSGSLGRHNFQG